MFGLLVQIALKDFLRVKRIWIWILLAGVIGAIGFVWGDMVRATTTVDAYVQISASFVFRIVALAAAVFSTAIVNQEVEQKTIVYLLTRPVLRWQLLLARCLAAFIVVFLVGALCTLTAAVTTGALGDPVVVRDLIAIAAGTLLYTALFVMFNLWMNRALTACLLYAFGWEVAIPNMPGDMYYLSVYSYMQAIAEHPVVGEGRGLVAMMQGQIGDAALMTSRLAWPLRLFVSSALLVAAAIWFSHFEYVPREDV
jgi:ABC-2 type transport system permease protein